MLASQLPDQFFQLMQDILQLFAIEYISPKKQTLCGLEGWASQFFYTHTTFSFTFPPKAKFKSWSLTTLHLCRMQFAIYFK